MAPSQESLAQVDRDHIIHPYLPATTTERVIMTRGKDCALWDAEGKEYLDATRSEEHTSELQSH